MDSSITSFLGNPINQIIIKNFLGKLVKKLLTLLDTKCWLKRRSLFEQTAENKDRNKNKLL
jgi:hypothetical protein